MLRKKFNDHWYFMKGSENPLADGIMNVAQEAQKGHLPHDAMAFEQRQSDTVSGSQSGFYPGGSYTYYKKFDVPMDWEQLVTVFEFEGVYTNAKVFINGAYAGGCTNGYRNFYIHAGMFLNYGETNEIKITVNNTAQPNSRWYSGSGIYRDVNILQSDVVHIAIDGVKISTPEIDEHIATVLIETPLVNDGHLPKNVRLETELLDERQQVVAKEVTKMTVFSEATQAFQRMAIESPRLWSIDSPTLYTCRIRVIENEQPLDEEQIAFGIRQINLDAVNGLRLNGQPVNLKGSCLHHDNGIIGAVSLYSAEERRCKLLKEAGFNCIRSAHQPMSKAMLDACDRVGMLVIDEVSDMWNVGKNHNDYATYFEKEYEEDIVRLVAKDFNHPSVIMYCLGNELSEAGTKKGAEYNRKINQLVKTFDNTRFTTNAINGLTAASTKLPLIFGELQAGQPMKAEIDQEDTTITNEGSNEVNSMMAVLVGPVADALATHSIMTESIEEFVSGTDVAGYNYMTARHELEHELHPNRIVLGTETFPSEIARLWKIVEEKKHVIGDMTWTGMDYLGEAGIGEYYYDGNRPFSNHWPDLVSYCGDIDLTGARKPISYYREIIFGLRKEPYIAVNRINHYGETCLKTPWSFKDAINSWTWTGYEGNPVIVDVYSDADEIELFLNDVSIGRKAVGEKEPFIATFDTIYQPGELKAVCYRNQKSAEGQTIQTAEEHVKLSVKMDKEPLVADGEDVAFIEIGLVDSLGRRNMQQKKEVSITVSGPGILEGFGSGISQTENSYKTNCWETYDGRLLAAIRSTTNTGTVHINLQMDQEQKTLVLTSNEAKN